MKNLTTTVYLFLTATFGFAQNHFWTLPNQAYDHSYNYVSPLPIPPPYPDLPLSTYSHLYYGGESSDYAHNIMLDENGEILFFIVDGRVYDGEGYLIAELIIDVGQTTDQNVTGSSEICIVPDPADCLRYYIFATSELFTLPVGAYTVLDLSLPNSVFGSLPEYSDRYGGLLFGDGLNEPNCEQVVSLNLPNGIGGTLGPTDNQEMFFAATDLNSNNERLVFVQIAGSIYSLKIDASGIYSTENNPIVIDEIDTSLPVSVPVSGRPEFEIFELENGNYRAGLAYAVQNGFLVAIIEMDAQGNYVPNSLFTYLLNSNNGEIPYVKGLEFSADGRFLFFSHHQVSVNQPAVQYIDYDLQQVMALNIPNASDYQYSQIELGFENTLFFAHASGLAALSDVNNPSQSNWTPDQLTMSYAASFRGDAGNSIYKAFTLQDQIDLMNYSDHLENCCLTCPNCFELNYHKDLFSATGSATWTPENNPLNNNSGAAAGILTELRIESGADITVTDMVIGFFDDARLIIEPGAKLTLNNTVLTAGPCEAQMWLGVEVWGDPQAAQLPYANQGYLRMENNSVIEHAYIGAMTASRQGSLQNNLFQANETGGVIRAYNSRFRNNQRDVLIQNYLNLNANGVAVPNQCYFENCDFLTDSPLNNPDVFTDYHTVLFRVRDVNFRNCSWRNTAAFENFEINQRGTGLYSLLATFRISGQNDPYEISEQSLPISNNVHQSFYQLATGILVWGQENHHFSVSKMEFQLNERGMVVFGVSKENIIFNNFEIPVVSDNYPNGGYGAYLMNTYLFTVEENNFFSNEVSLNTGLIVDNSNKDAAFTHLEVDNEVYRNTFDKLNVGISVVNNNRGWRQNVGLQARCNVFSAAGRADIYLTPETEWRDDQGSGLGIELLTNNVFSYPTYASSFPYRDVRVDEDYGILSGTNNLPFQYWSLENDPTTKPVFDVTDPQPIGQAHMEITHNPQYSSVILDYENHCPSNFTNTGGSLSPLATLLQTRSLAENNLQNALAVYQATVDGGETEDILVLLQNMHSEESAFLRDLLLARHPLSREALMAAIEAAESFDPWHLTQILVGNSRLPGDVYLFLNNHNVLTPFFMQFVDDAQQNGGANLARLLHAEIAHRSYEKSVSERAIHRHFLYHSDSIDYAGLDTLLQSRQEPHYALHLLGEHLDRGETGSAKNILDSLPIHENRKDWIDLMIDIHIADTITASDYTNGWDFFYNKPQAKGDAWGWLYANEQTDSLPAQPLVVEPKSGSLLYHEALSKPERFLQAWPNPAKDRVVLTYPREANGMGVVQLFNADGRLVHEFNASDAGFQEISVTGWSPGLYIAKLIVNGKDFETVKISVVR